MPVKKATPKKVATARAATKKAAPRKATRAPARATTKAAIKRGAGYSCHVCGLVVTVDETCGCAEVHDIVCCGKSMKPVKAKAKAR